MVRIEIVGVRGDAGVIYIQRRLAGSGRTRDWRSRKRIIK